MKQLFDEGTYIPLALKGTRKKNIIAFARKKENLFAILIIPRFFTSLIEPCVAWNKADIEWADTCISLPEVAPKNWTEVFTDRTLHSEGGSIHAKDALSVFPGALLFSGGQNG